MATAGFAYRGGDDFGPMGPSVPRIGEILIARCGVPPDSIERALAKQREEGGLIGEVLLHLKLIDEEQLAAALAFQFDMAYLREMPRPDDIPAELIDKLPINFARQRLVLPIGFALLLFRFGQVLYRILTGRQLGMKLVDEAAEALKLKETGDGAVGS